MKFNELKIGRKLQIYAFFVSLIFISGGLMALNSVGRLSGYIEHTYTDNVVPAVKISGILEQLLEYRILLRRHVLSSSVEEMKKLRAEMTKIEAEVIALTEAKDKYRLTGEEEKVFIAFANDLKPLFDASQEALQLSESFSKEDADKKMLTERIVFERSKEALLKLIKIKEGEVKADYETSLSIKKTAWLMTTLIIFGGLGIVIISSVFITRSISASIRTAVSTVSTSATQIASTVEQHERTASQQAASVSETTTTIDELGASSRQSTEQADAVAAMAKQALTTTDEGVKMARQASDGMVKMKEKVEGIGVQILHLSEQTGQIGKIATMVTDIAGQINMLALNAAVEAVRAGEQGKGFAVIAQEVRKLADQGKKSAEQANTIVADIQKATNSAVMVTEEGTKTVLDVAGIAQKAGEAFASLSGVATNVYENAQQVSLNSRQQGTAIKQVTDAMNSINAGAKETAAGISQTKIGIQRLNEAAQGLKKIV